MTPEKRVQNNIVDYFHELQQQGELVFIERRQAGGYSYKKGIPDLYAVVNGYHLEIEVKKPGGELSSMQEKFRDRCFKLGILWVCADKVDDVKEFVKYLLTFPSIVSKAQ